MGALNPHNHERLVQEIFAETGIAISKEDPLFALVEILRREKMQQAEALQGAADSVIQAVHAATDRLEHKTEFLESIAENYIQARIEAANASIDQEARRIAVKAQDDLTRGLESLAEALSHEVAQRCEKGLLEPLKEITEDIPQRSWIESTWTLAACLAIGFMAGFIYFDQTVRIAGKTTASSMSHPQ